MKLPSVATRLLLLAITSAFALSACNTIQGAGKDIEKTGEVIQDKAEDAK